MKTYLKVIAWTMFILGAFTALGGLIAISNEAATGLPLLFGGITGGIVFGGLFLFFSKLVEQNEEIINRLSNATK